MDLNNPPFPAEEAKTSEQRKEWLAWYFDSQEERNKQSKAFYDTSRFCLLFAFFAITAVPLAIAIGNKLIFG